MRSQKGIGLVRLVIFIVAMMLLLGVTTYVVVQENGIYDREVRPIINNYLQEENTTVEK
jgi:hypothetical protein